LSELLDTEVRAAVPRGTPVRDGGMRWYSGAYLPATVPTVMHSMAQNGHDSHVAMLVVVNATLDNDTFAAIWASRERLVG